MSDAGRFLIVNADDFGQTPGVNRGVAIAHDRGIVTSASLMVRWPAAAGAATFARAHPRLSLGLHVDLCEWTRRDGRWHPIYQVVDLEDAAAVERAVADQLARFHALVGAGPTHLDSHQHVHQHEPVRAVLARLARRLRIPLRGHSRSVRYCGEFYGQDTDGQPVPEAITAARLIEILARLPPGVTELGCHPGADDSDPSMYARERSREVAVLCDPAVRRAMTEAGIRLCSFGTRPRRPADAGSVVAS